MMPVLRLSPALLIAAGLGLLAGCENLPLPIARQGTPAIMAEAASASPAAPLDPVLLQPDQTAFRLGPGDQLDIEVVGDQSTRASVTVGPDGKIYYSMLHGVDVWGMTLPEAQSRLAAGLREFIRAEPVVSIALRAVASRRLWILGRVESPGVYVLDGPTTLLEAVAGAGGLSTSATPAGGAPESADLSRSFLIRDGHLVPVDFDRLLREGELSQNIYVQPDDFIFLPSVRTSQVYVLGAVLQPHSERMTGALTVVQSIALAGGTGPEACLSNVAILRGSLSNPQIAVVPVDAILHGKAPDVRLEANDIVYVPYSPNRVLTRYVNLILDTFVRTVGINEGAYAISRKSTPVGVGVNVGP